LLFLTLLQRSFRKESATRASPAVAVFSSALTAFSPLSALAQTARRVEPVEQKSSTVTGGDGARWALVIGLDKYQSPEIPPLQGAVADAKAIAAALVRYADFSPQQVVTLTTDGPNKPTAAAIIDKLSELRSAVKPGDLFLFFFAGHGVEVEGRRFLLTYEVQATSPGALKMSSLPVSNLMQELEELKVRDRIIMVDACRDDPLNRGQRQLNVATAVMEAQFTLQPSSEAGVRATFLSSTRGESAYEWTEKGRGFFSYFIEKGLSGEAGVYGKVTLNSLSDYLNENVPQAVRQQRGKEQTPFSDLKGQSLTLVRGEKMAVNPETLRTKAAATRTVYGVVKDSNGVPMPGTPVRLAWAGVNARGAAGSPTGPQDLRLTADEDGFFKVDVPAEASVEISAQSGSFGTRTVTASPAENGKKVSLFLPRAAAPPSAAPVVAPVTTPVPAPVAVAANVPPPAASAPPVTRPAPTAAVLATTVAPPAPAPTASAPKPTVAAPAAPPPATKPVVTIAAVPTPPPPAAVATSGPPAAPIIPPAARPATATPVAPPVPAPVAAAPATKPPVAVASASAPPSAQPPAPTAALPSLPTTSVQAQELAKVAYQTFLVEDFDDAQKAARSALELDLDNGLAQAVLVNCLAVEGVNKSDATKLATAKEMSQKLLQGHPTMALAHNAMGLTLVGAKDVKGAQKEFASANALDPTLGVAGANLGYTFFQLKQLKDAEKAYRAAIKARPEAAVSYNGLAQVLLARGDAGDAVKAARNAISRYELRDVYLASFYVNLAVALFQDGKRDQALEAVARAKSLGLEQNAAYELIEKAPAANGKKKG
jgi:Tfp pilus assembly protein PilF